MSDNRWANNYRIGHCLFRFCIDYAKRQAGCKKCKQKIEKGELRIAKITPSPFR
jgi:hypothetical protein